MCLRNRADWDAKHPRSPDAILEDGSAFIAGSIKDLRIVWHSVSIRVMVEHPSLVRADHEIFNLNACPVIAVERAPIATWKKIEDSKIAAVGVDKPSLLK